MPLADCKPVYRRANVQRVLVAGDTMAVASSDKTQRNLGNTWRLFDLRNGRIIREIPFKYPWLDQAMLSHDGCWFGVKTETSEVAVYHVPGGTEPFVTSPGHSHTNAMLRLSAGILDIVIGKKLIRLEWHGTALQITRLMDRHPGQPPTHARPGLYDPERFRQSVKVGDLEAVLDGFGQVILLRNGVLAILLAYQGHFCFWMPDGTRHGPAHLTGGPETPDAKERLWAALRSE